MAAIVSFASGKGGVGKSTTVSNLGLLLARGGRSVVMLDLDVGGADLHILFGEMSPARTLSDFLEHRVESLEELAQPLPVCAGLRLIAGTGETLRTANPTHQAKLRLERHVRALAADVVLIDIGAGTGSHALDFFLWADVQVVVSTPDPTAVLDLYRFVKLAAARRVLLAIGAREELGEAVAEEDPGSIAELLARARAAGPQMEARAAEALRRFRPNLLFNNAGERDRGSAARLIEVIQRFLGAPADILGTVPEDPAV
ncbi:MAG TPA: P-loop NTPase, partial [Myxococcales bacterium]|nr:P-loop NTPase [Myxococcales bacterium]